MRKTYLLIALRTKIDTFKWEYGERLIETLSSNEGLLVPDLISHNADKIKDPFPGKAGCEAWWAEMMALRFNGSLSEHYRDFAWRRKKNIKSSGYLMHKMKNNRDNIVPAIFNFEAIPSEKINWLLLFKSWCEIFPPQIGMLHVFTPPEISIERRLSNFSIGSFGAALKPKAPNIAWAMVYGDEFADKVDVAQISAAGFPIEKLGNAYLVRVTEDIQDVVEDFPFFSQRREELRSLFPKGFFSVDEETDF